MGVLSWSPGVHVVEGRLLPASTGASPAFGSTWLPALTHLSPSGLGQGVTHPCPHEQVPQNSQLGGVEATTANGGSQFCINPGHGLLHECRPSCAPGMLASLPAGRVRESGSGEGRGGCRALGTRHNLQRPSLSISYHKHVPSSPGVSMEVEQTPDSPLRTAQEPAGWAEPPRLHSEARPW